MPFLLDTCAIVFIAENTADLSPATLQLIDAAPAGEVFVSAISVAELACLQERRKVTLKQTGTTSLRRMDWRRPPASLSIRKTKFTSGPGRLSSPNEAEPPKVTAPRCRTSRNGGDPEFRTWRRGCRVLATVIASSSLTRQHASNPSPRHLLMAPKQAR